jgi:hypothetical protein
LSKLSAIAGLKNGTYLEFPKSAEGDYWYYCFLDFIFLGIPNNDEHGWLVMFASAKNIAGGIDAYSTR